jgi:hypothetical protein
VYTRIKNQDIDVNKILDMTFKKFCVGLSHSLLRFLMVHRLTGVPKSCLHGGTLPKSSKQQQQEIDYDFSNQSYIITTGNYKMRSASNSIIESN